MSIFTINGSPVKYGNKWLANGGTPSDELPPYDSTNAGQALVVNEDGDGVEWQDVGSSITVDQTYDPTSTNPQSGTAVAEALQTVPDELPPITGKAGKVLKVNSGATGVEWANESGGATYTAGNGIDITGDEISVDTSVVATQTDLSGKQDVLTAGTNIQINNDVISATDTTYSAGTGLTLTGTEFSADTTVLATQQDLSGKQDTLTAGSNITISNNVISATDTTYSAGTGLSLNGTTFSVDDPLPTHTSSDEGKILKVDSNGDLEWGAESGGTVTDVQVNGTSVVSGGVADITVPAAQVNSDWTASSGVAEILHKPTEKTLAAGSNVTITEANNTVTISATGTTYTAGTGIDITSGVISADTSVLATQNDLSSKQDTLTAGTNISISNNVISATDTTYSAGEGIDITNNEISVEAPVDIVAGPGIVIDNPDGNTLRVSVSQAEEVVLYDAGDSPSQAGPWQISEARTNFEWVDIVFGNDSTGSMKQVTRFAADSEYMKLHLPRYDEEPSYKWSTMTLSWNNTTASIKTNSVGRFTIASNGSVSVSTAASQAPYLFQIIGVHRINGGN